MKVKYQCRRENYQSSTEGKVKGYLVIGIVLLVSLIYASSVRAQMGLTVDPGRIIRQDVALGKVVSVGDLTIRNQGAEAQTYLLSVHKPSQVGNKKWCLGYLEIPDIRWIWFEKKEIEIAGKSSKRVKVYCKIPRKKRYYNQHWTASLEVKGKPGPGRLFTLALHPSLEMETESYPDKKPAGQLAVSPTIVSFENLPLGKEETRSIKLYNNDKVTRVYRLTPLSPSDSMTKQFISRTPGYERLPNAGWIILEPREIRLKAGEGKRITLKLTIPKDNPRYNKKWEGLLLIRPSEKDPSGFVRIRVETENKSD